MAGNTSQSMDEAIRVVVTPSQASFFAGEPFSVTITFTNTRTPEAPVAPRPSYSHKRGAHSISSVPLARPPTSPGTPRTVVPVFPSRAARGGTTSQRKGLIGHGLSSKLADEPPSAEVLRKRLLASRSLSVTLAPQDLPSQDQSNDKSPSPSSPALPVAGPCSVPEPPATRIVAPLARTPSLPPNHPHARKQSILDGQLQLHDLRSALPSALPPTPNPSTSTFSLSLDPIAEGGSTSPGPPATPSFPSPIPDSDIPNVRTHIPSSTNGVKKLNGTHLYPSAPLREPPRRPSLLGLGHGPPPSPSGAYLKPPRTAFSSSFPVPNTELILYAYAQLLGSLTISPLPEANTSPEHARALNHLRARLLKRKAVGGGSMDITSSLSASSLGPPGGAPMRRGSHGRSSSLSAGLLSMLSPTALVSSPSQPAFVPGHRARTSSVFSLFSNGQAPPTSRSAGVGLGLSASVPEDEVDPEAPLPTLEVQPSMLAVDLSLGPGESRTYTYSLVLPDNLPPTFRGRALKFSYQFILGVCRAGSAASPGAGPSSNSRVMKVPIRVYNNVTVGKPLRPYDMLWPVTSQRGPAPPGKVTEGSAEATKRTSPLPTPRPAPLKPGSYEDLQEYARNLLASFPDPKATGVRIKLPIEAIQSSRSAELDRQLEDDLDSPTGCRQAVEVLTRNPRKASYDVTKDGVKVAVLTFPKSAYRLGETILGVVETNDRASRARVLKLSAMLEAHESLPSNIAPPGMSRQLRRVHAEHHSCFMASTLRTTFSLDIPPDASPAFQASLEDPSSLDSVRPGGLEWKVRLCLLVAIASPTSREGPEGVRLRQLVRDGPKGQWGSSWKAARTIAPLERPGPLPTSPGSPSANGELTAGGASAALSWVSYFTSTLLGPTSVDYHDGDEDLEEDEDEVGPEESWRDVKVEMVECEVPVKVWPANTAFKATEVVFDV
ncbi:Rgp1-domain-containing protein [Trametes coccinea BRFM310]|uniref:Rgp1-domain-containing protein n=1 Tax=Trametes coccinea (strain BRFM310) TaxID=1353009 RepID=A0A1Y2IXC1_TRAC3|nr:Rgp1-domain-containing protein [Trametes coccinea BRFM310]